LPSPLQQLVGTKLLQAIQAVRVAQIPTAAVFLLPLRSPTANASLVRFLLSQSSTYVFVFRCVWLQVTVEQTEADLAMVAFLQMKQFFSSKQLTYN
jgi:hypothetical protein